MPSTALNPGNYWSEVQLLSAEIEDAVIIFHTYEEINRLLLHDAAILIVVNKNALFWQTQMHCLQTSLFLTLSRIFDNKANARTIHTLVNGTLGNLPLFNVAALASRKTSGGDKPDWFDKFLAAAWIPTSPKDLRHLKTALSPYATRFNRVYRPIRHAIFAHRLMTDAEAGVQLFPETSRDEIAAILDFLHDLIATIENLYLNGSRPELGKRDFTEYNQRIREGAGKVLNSLR